MNKQHYDMLINFAETLPSPFNKELKEMVAFNFKQPRILAALLRCKEPDETNIKTPVKVDTGDPDGYSLIHSYPISSHCAS